MRVIGLAAVAAPSNAGRDHPGRRSAPRIKIDVRGHPGDRWVVDPVNLGADQRFCAISYRIHRPVEEEQQCGGTSLRREAGSMR